MLGQAVLFTFFLLLRAHQSQDCSDSSVEVIGVSGEPVQLQPFNIQTKVVSVQWKKRQQGSHAKTYEILNWCTSDFHCSTVSPSDSYSFDSVNFTLSIKSAKLEDSGHYQLEITNNGGNICTKKFHILIFDHVGTPHLKVQQKPGAHGTCQLFLSCLVPKDDNVSYALYRGSTLISNQRNGTYWENQTDPGSLHTYTCNVSNKASWANHTLTFSHSCQDVPLKFRFLHFVVIISILVTLFLGAIICFCVWNKKRKQSQSSPKELLTIYEYVKDSGISRDQQGHSRASGSSSAVQEEKRGHKELDRRLFEVLEQMPEQKFPGDRGIMYSMIQCKPSDSTSQEKCTIYSVVHPSRKSGSKKRNQNPSLNCTVYEEVRFWNSPSHWVSCLWTPEIQSRRYTYNKVTHTTS
ncbi:natural killer cell receptor 2B4 isoform X2 [Grammomys surdaster]|uniref:natural killer cell receptor 2B4 isoform X2 n=1 Tax=Grammomys surdaster TaxID=491861 RepID=UPI0010A0134E|nr:natural killer cell receptor 2B4 isoform X2 [Grammomys surdaster]